MGQELADANGRISGCHRSNRKKLGFWQNANQEFRAYGPLNHEGDEMNIFQKFEAECMENPIPDYRTYPDNIAGFWRERATGRVIQIITNSPYFDDMDVCDVTDSLARIGPTRDAPKEPKFGFCMRFEPYVKEST